MEKNTNHTSTAKMFTKIGLVTGVLLMSASFIPSGESTNMVANLVGVQSVEASSVSKYTTTANLNLRAGASTKHKVLGSIPKGKEIQYLSKSGSWYKVKYGTKTGWVSSTYVKQTAVKSSASAPKAPATPKASAVKTVTKYTTTTNLNMRAGASTKHKHLLTIPKGKEVKYISTSGSWFKVSYANQTGWVSSSYVKKTTVNATPAPAPAPKPAPAPAPKAPSTPKAPTTVQATKHYTTTASLNMRTGGSTSHKVVLLIPAGKTVAFTGVKASTGWYQVAYAGKTGYVSPSYLKLVIPTTYKTTPYPITLNEMVNLQFKLNGQTDAYRTQAAYVRKTNVELKKPTDKTGTLLVDSPVVDSATTHVFGTLKADEKVKILGETKLFYKVEYQAWRNAKAADITPNADPKRFAKGTAAYYQFLDLSASAKVSTAELNKVLSGKGILHNHGKSFIDAGKAHSVNEVYLVSHALLETGHGASPLSKGIVVSKVNGKDVAPKKVYNMFGIGAHDIDAVRLGSERAYVEGWTTPEKAIMGGAKFIGEMYVNHPEFKQNTLYKMRWNPATPGEHQYATDIGWAVKQTKSIDALYKSLIDYTLTFDVPVYK